MQIHLARDNVPAGPYSLDELNTMLQSGEVLPTDLMWHEGMDNWRTVGEMTGDHPHYDPNGDPNATHHTVTLTKTPVAANTSDDGQWHGRHATVQPITETQTVFASVGSRFLAFVINMVLLILTVLPLQMAVMALGVDASTLSVNSVAEYQALGERLAKDLSPTAIYGTFLMMMGLALVQLLLLAKRGQSLGKLAVGIRIVDEKSHRLASFGQVLAVRTLLLFVIYQVSSSVANFLALGLLLVNYVMASKSATHQGWHDKISKTVVVKAHPSQLDPTKI